MTSLWLRDGPVIPVDDGPLPARSEAVVAGAGLTGLALATLLVDAGMRVTVLEARTVGAVTTGNTTGKLSLLQGGTLAQLREHAGDDVLRAYVDANRAGQEWVRHQFADDPDAVVPRDAVTYATTHEGLLRLQQEREALGAAGLEAEWLAGVETVALRLPFPVLAALRMPNQAQLQPIRVLATLAQRLRDRGVRILTGRRVVGADVDEHGVAVHAGGGRIVASMLLLATGAPILDRGLFFAKLVPSRSFVAAYRLAADTPAPAGMLLSVDDISRSIRVEPGGELVVGGGAHTPGRVPHTSELLSELHAWTMAQWPGAMRELWWAAQDYRMVTHVPFAGPLPRGGGRIFVATGFDKWGMTNAPAAALQLAGRITGHPTSWEPTLISHRPGLADARDAVRANSSVGGHLVGDWVKAGVSSASADAPPEGSGRVIRTGMSPVAESTVDGVTRRLSGVCTHLGGIVTWNDAECTWDCPLHGSRFSAAGAVLEGPAVHPLERAGD